MLDVDSAGNLKNIQVVTEDPPYLGFAQAALNDFDGAKFIPAFRDGKPVDSKVTIPIYYKPSGF
jgi:outer membrane biosynthesis protein TonB